MIILKRFLLTLQRDQRGAAALTYLLCFPLILLALLGSIDFIRYSMAQGKLQNALDTAVISAGRNLDTFTPVPTGSDEELKWRADAKSYFFSNMPRNFLGSSITKEQVIVTYSEETDDSGNTTGGQLVSMSATGTLPLLVTGMINKTSFNLSATNQAVRRTRSDLEMVLALDLTGSMANDGRIEALTDASKALVSTILDAAENADNLDQTFIGIVPFADTVYIGDEKRVWLTDEAQAYPYIKEGNVWGGCVVEPYKNNRFAAEPGRPGQFEPLMTVGTLSTANGLVTTDTLKKWYVSSKGINSKQVNDFRVLESPTIEGNHVIQANLDSNGDIVPQFAFNPSWLYRSDMKVHDYCSESREMTFLSNDKSALLQKIDAMGVDGGTVIPLGLLWSWRMLDPHWRSDNINSGWGDGNKPREAATGLNKIIVLLTDGNNGLDPNTSPTAINGVGIDGERNISGSYTINYHYQVETNNQGQFSPSTISDTNCTFNVLSESSLSRSTITGSARYTCSFSNLNDDNHYFSYGYANRSDFSSLRVGSDAELNNSRSQLTPYGALFAGKIGDQEDWEYGNPTLNSLTSELCENIKNEDIIIYTVVLGYGVNDSTKTMMQNCSSGAAGYYYDATTVSNLSDAFESIAESLTELRLTE